MKIAMISTTFLTTPPAKSGGTERVVSILTEGLVKRGHEVTLFATGDSKTTAELDYLYPHPEWSWEKEAAHARYAFSKAKKFEIVHNHSYLGLPLVQDSPVPTVTTIHSLSDSYRQYKDGLYICISNRQRFIFRDLKKVRVAYHGLEIEQFPFSPDCEDYLVWVGRFCPEKGVHHAIRVAKRLDMPLKLIGVVGDVFYYEQEIKPHLGGKIEYLGEMDERKNEIVKKAKCFLMPILWEEPFGLVMVEAMACGTPVISFNKGSAMELIHHGKTGFIVTSEEEMVEAVRQVGKIDRLMCRRHVVENFSADKMVAAHEQIYEDMLAGKFR
ncbi:glycosyltransferase family 4 protein [Zhaonella formicivorans]|uniref:glycosyltransferase family 4 protein n=1 Tax=Zhaonella formicivorans TaxID=2528593 RepID=UPI0010E8560E|nr:glycosyltransferase family 4 protein [Zhaonella formicivorans]